MNSEFAVHDGVVRSRLGLPATPRWITDGRLAVELDDYGVTQVDYFSRRQRQGSPTLFYQRLFPGFRVYVERDRRRYSPQPADCELLPFGYRCRWPVDGIDFRLEWAVAGERLIVRLTAPEDVPEDCLFRLEFHDAFGLTPRDEDDARYKSRGERRDWLAWQFEAERAMLVGGFRAWPEIAAGEQAGAAAAAAPAEAAAEAAVADGAAAQMPGDAGPSRGGDSGAVAGGHRTQWIGVAASFPVRCAQTPRNRKLQLIGTEPMRGGRSYSYAIVFADEREALLAAGSPTDGELARALAAMHARYAALAARTPRLRSGDAELDAYFALLPMHHEPCKVPDEPGALKAKTSQYWVWGWDGLTSNQASLYWGDEAAILDMLRFYRRTAHPVHGIVHAYRPDGSAADYSAVPAQGMYITLLQQYAACTGDASAAAELYPFARELFAAMAALEVGQTGLCVGTSLYPDFRELILETGRDISSMNNTFFYCAARAMAYLADVQGDEATKAQAIGIVKRFEAHFAPLFGDPTHRFPVSSVDADTLQRREAFHNCAVKWDNGYMRELTQGMHADHMQFFERELLAPGGVRPIPLWCEAYDADANQLHAWWPVTGEYYMRLMNLMDRPDLLGRWTGWLRHWYRQLSCPEGVPLYAERAEPEADRWNAVRGAWQAYSMRAWWQAVVHGLVGIDLDAGGVHLYPSSGPAATLEGLYYRGRRLDVEVRGQGPYLTRLTVNGRPLAATHKLPSDVWTGVGGRDRIVAVRGTTPPPGPLLLYGYGIELTGYTAGTDGMAALATGAGLTRIAVRFEASAAERLVVRVDGAEVPPWEGAAVGEGTTGAEAAVDCVRLYELPLHPAEPRSLDIRAIPVGPAALAGDGAARDKGAEEAVEEAAGLADGDRLDQLAKRRQ
ncbi:hypothetical protein IDH44_17585 [Paenibacillus sp. IB182496]|uniref:Alpha-L-rhamnosidase six-hairpin glycosidase domain-containing protein n=1 Tax=Paenibacillus sabuli TaxID=2772509 RepID=A0A927BX88_9BACL|nr:hypothetical protein [Paenibacillus sabuli]MBD2847013.1 hypothetical protein [Paenibacillus sabuli]